MLELYTARDRKMKIRDSFVSNSSSTSYIIKIHKEKSKKCPTCGRGNDLDLLEIIRNGDHLDSKIGYDTKEDYMRELEFQMRRVKKDIEEFAALEPNEVPERFRRSAASAKELLEWSHRELKELRDEYDQVAAIEGEVVAVDIGYHDEIVKYAFEAGQKDGSIEIISSMVF